MKYEVSSGAVVFTCKDDENYFVIKRIIYFLTEYDNQQICYQEEELEGAYLMTYEEAINVFQFESSKGILNEAKEFIYTYKKSS